MFSNFRFTGKVLFFSFCIGVAWLCATQFFWIEEIAPGNQRGCVALSAENEKAFFGQEYHYLASGVQSCSFVSADGKYVLKFFQKRTVGSWLREQFNSQRAALKKGKLEKAFAAYELAFEELKEETGLLYLHFSKEPVSHSSVTVKTGWGWKRKIPLGCTAFVIQEKAELLFPYMQKLYEKGNENAAAEAMASVLRLVQGRIGKGFADQDQAVSHNYGFVGNRPVQFDVGRLYKGEKKGEYERIKSRIEQLCNKAQHHPSGDLQSEGFRKS